MGEKKQKQVVSSPVPWPWAALDRNAETQKEGKHSAFNRCVELKDWDCWQHYERYLWCCSQQGCGMAGKAQHIAVLLPAPSDLRAHHPQCGEQDHALHAVWLQGCLGFPALLLHSKNSETPDETTGSTKHDQRTPKKKPPPTTTENSGCTEQVCTVKNFVWMTSELFSTSTLCVVMKGLSTPNVWVWP